MGWAKFHYSDVQDAIYGNDYFVSGLRVHAGTLCLILLGVIGLLAFIVVTEQLDY